MPYLVFIASLISPIYTFGLSLFELIKRNTSILPLISFSLAFGMLAGTIDPPPGWDLDTHYKHLENLRGLPLNYIVSNAYSGYLGFDTYAWFIFKLGLPKQMFTASIVFTAYFIVLLIFRDMKSSIIYREPTIYIAFYLLILWLSIDFIYLTSGLRNSFANIVVLFATYNLIFYKKYLLFVLLSILAFYIHPAALLPILLTLFSIFFPSISKYSKALAIISVLLIIVTNPVTLILNYIEGFLLNLSFYKPAYFSDGQWGSGFTENRTLIGLIGIFLIARLPTYIALCYFLLKKHSQNSILQSLVSITLVYLSFFFSYYTLFDRVNAFFLLIFSIYIIHENVLYKNKLNNLTLKIYLITLIFYSIYHLYIYKPFIYTAIPSIFKPLLVVIFGL